MDEKKTKVNSNFTKLTHKGVSLIVLIVTIIVIVILAATVVLTLSINNPIESAREARFKEDVRTFQDELNMYISKEYAQLQGKRDEKITAKEYSQDKGNHEAFNKSVYKYVTSFKKKYEGKLVIKDDMIAYIGTDENERCWLLNSGVYMSKKITVKYVDENGDKLLEDHITTVLDNEYSIDLPEIEGYLAFNEKLEGKIVEDKEITAKYYTICNNLAFTGLDSNENETEDESSIVSYTVSGIGECNSPNIAIPVEYNGKEVTQIKEEAFKNNTLINSVIISNNIKIAGGRAFESCINLTSVKLDSNVIGGSLFRYCRNLEKVEIGKHVNTIQRSAFYNCGRLSYFKIYSENINLGAQIFANNDSLEEIKVNIGNEVYIVEDGVLYTKNKETLVMYPPNKSGAFIVPNGVKKIASNAFCASNKITDVEISSLVDYVYNGTFEGCRNLTSVNIDSNVIGGTLFRYCINLEKVEIGKNVKKIDGIQIFAFCPKLTNLTYLGTIEEWNKIHKSAKWNISSSITTITCTDGIIEL